MQVLNSRIFIAAATWVAPIGVTTILITVHPDRLSMDAGASALQVVDDAHNIWAWGQNSNGRLGDNSISNRSSPILVVGGRSFIQIAGGTYSAAIEKNSFLAYAWGVGTVGQLGDNTLISKSSPVAVAGNRRFIDIAIGNNFALAIEKDTYDLYAWGENTNGKLGNNSITNSSSPVLVAGGRKFISVAAGSQHSLAIEKDTNALFAWGQGIQGQLGDNSATNKSSPVAVAGGRSFTYISAFSHSLAIEKTTELAYAWGINGAGNLGDNSISNRSSPTAVAGGRKYISIAAGGSIHSVAIEKDTYAAYGWGNNFFGAIGNNSTTNTSSPVLTAGGKSFVQITAGADFTAAIEKDTHAVYGWGENSSGQLGQNNLTSTSSPILVLGSFRTFKSALSKTISINVIPGQSYTINPAMGKFGSTSLPFVDGSVVKSIQLQWFE